MPYADTDPFRDFYTVETYLKRPGSDVFAVDYTYQSVGRDAELQPVYDEHQPHQQLDDVTVALLWRPKNLMSSPIPLYRYDSSLAKVPHDQLDRAPAKLERFTISLTAESEDEDDEEGQGHSPDGERPRRMLHPAEVLFEGGRPARILYLPMLDSHHLVRGQPHKRA